MSANTPRDDKVLVKRSDLAALLGARLPVQQLTDPEVAATDRLLDAVNGEAATVEYDMFDGKCHRRVVGPWTTQETNEQARSGRTPGL